MATIQNRPFSKDYSGLINQSVVAGVIFLITVSAHEVMKRKRRGKGPHGDELGSVESWEFGYLYQGRSWAKRPSPPHPRGWPLGWIKPVLKFPEDRMNQLRGVDATLYIRFLRGCFWFALLQTLTTLPILLPIHVTFSDGTVSPKSMTRASISSLVSTEKGLSLLWVHIILLFWVTFTWFGTLFWICRGAFHYRAQNIVAAASRAASETSAKERSQYDPHPHPQYPFHSLEPLEEDHSTRGLRLRTVMVTNIPHALRSEKDLKEYFEYYLCRSVARPAIGVTSSTQPGFLNRMFTFLFNRARRIPAQVQRGRNSVQDSSSPPESARSASSQESEGETPDIPAIDRVVIVRKMNDLASLLERREEILRLLETAHIKLARKALAGVQSAMANKQDAGVLRTAMRRMSIAAKRMSGVGVLDVEAVAECEPRDSVEGEDRMELLIRTLKPYLPEPGSSPIEDDKTCSGWRTLWKKKNPDLESRLPRNPEKATHEKTVWDALLSLPRSTLDAYQPLIHLSSIFRGKTVPAIDYYTAKLQIVTNMITEKRSMAISDFEPMPTAFVTFVDPADARRACKYLAVHPENPLQCLVTMAPSFEDLDWKRLMKPTFRVEFVKDWVVELGVWAFTLFWVFPVSIFVGLVNIQNLSTFIPGLLNYLDKHQWEEELLQSFLPTVLVALLSLLIPLILLLIAKRAHTIATLSALHDRIMTRYYKFLVVNVLVFFCVGTAALQSFLVSFKNATAPKVAEVISQSFPVAGPFYVGWFIFTMAMHGGVELALCDLFADRLTHSQLPLIMYPATKRQITPRKRAMGIRPRTFNYYYWLPNHVLVIHVLLVFAILNPLVIPFAFIYFCVEATVVKNQLLHVYAKNYEGNGQTLLVRIVRYSLDVIDPLQVVFLAYMVVNKKTVNVGLSAVLIIITAGYKMFLTRLCRARFERDDILEAQVVCGTGSATEDIIDDAQPSSGEALQSEIEKLSGTRTEVWPWRFPLKFNFPYATIASRPRLTPRRGPNPFGPAHRTDSTIPLNPSSPSGAITPECPTSPEASLQPCREASSEPEPNEESVAEDSPASSAVSKHPPHPAWEDESSTSHTYANPYYTRNIDNVLWLPRDPLGILDLDDTVDLRMSLTTQPGAGRLGAWREEDYIDTEMSIPFVASMGSIDETESLHPSYYRRLDGTEDIELPPAIASRIGSIDKDEEIEIAPVHRRQSRRRKSNHSAPGMHLGVRRPSTFDVTSSSAFRSMSIGSDSRASSRIRGRSASFFVPSDPRRRNRAASMDYELGMRRSSQHRHVSRSVLSVVEPPSSHPFPAREPSQGAGSKVISVQEAVYTVAIAEEEDAAEDMKEREEEEEEQLQQPKSWLTSWMFSRAS
ncbi:DUF221-domain-containing protein [Trametes coccinea BRFM310]|uniref:DUF221-domain-containing protein n=1 Tax=Trametes coccinea (strain BRFM310) TaxID=1353009 RepID=A0A1Y2IMT3_TRAC3|nr:DUF221-domain-containing protein [Trametes coccinea BRFM310]